MFILVLGDSRSLPRVSAKVGYQETYPYLMREWWESKPCGKATVWPWADGSVLIKEVLARYKKFRFYFGEERLNVCLLMVGLVDCAPRPLSWGVRDRLGRWPEPIKRRVIRLLHWARPWLLSRGLFFRFTETPEFRRILVELLGGLSKGFERVYVLNIAPAARRNYEHSPGLKESVEEYNNVIAEEAIRWDNLHLVDVWSGFQKSGVPIETYLCEEDDRIHFTAQGHKLVQDLIVEQERQFGERHT